jgi:DNA-binding PucR family transcriptional regulator
VPANVAPELLAASRDLVRRGLRESAVRAYQIGQNALWEHWMQIAFGLTSDADELRELLQVSARSLFSFIDVTNAAIAAQIQTELEELTRGDARRTAGGGRVNYGRRTHQFTARRQPVGVQAGTDPHRGRDLERADAVRLKPTRPGLETLARTADAARPLSVVASATTRWVWIPAEFAPDPVALGRVIDELRGVRIAIGSTAHGIEGFRRSHLDALATQRLLTRLHSTQHVASFHGIQLVSLVTETPSAWTNSSRTRSVNLRRPVRNCERPCLPLSPSSATHPARRHGFIPTETRCCAG